MPPIRTITFGVAEPHPIPRSAIEHAHTILREASRQYNAASYEVQTIRIATRPLFVDLADWSSADILAYVGKLQRWLTELGLEYCSLGTVPAAQPAFPLERLELLADILAATHALSATVQLATLNDGIRSAAALPTARIIQRLAHETQEGFGNFRFAMLACVDAGCPFFPAAYHAGPASLAIGLQGASIIAEVLRAHAQDLTAVTPAVRDALEEYASPLVALGQRMAQEHNLLFGGIDLSPAPMGEDSIVAALELFGAGTFGSPGTLAVVAALTAALKSTRLPTCGYNGIMLPVLEDALLGRRWEQEQVHVHQLLLYSAVCGTGLDTIPLPGDSPTEMIAHLLLDVATLALRLRKPLSARLFPVPGRQAGEHTVFTSPYLTNTLIK